MQLRWKKDTFSKNCTLYKGYKKVGKLKGNCWDKQVKCRLHDKRYVFQTSGFIRQKTAIIDTTTNKKVGSIRYIHWRKQAVVRIFKTSYRWKFDNFLHDRWSMKATDNTELAVKFRGSALNGKAKGKVEDELILLAGYFIQKHFKSRSLA